MAAFDEMAEAQFENVNSLRSYPFSDGAVLVDRNGLELPKDAIVDLHMVVPADFVNPESDMSHDGMPSVRLSSLHVSSAMVSACFISVCGGVKSALSVSVSASKFKPYVPYMMEKVAGAQDIGGIVTFGDMERPWSPYTYFMDSAIVHPCCITAAKPPALRSFIDARSGESVSGDVGIEFSGHIVAKRSGDSFSLSLDKGSAAELASECAMASGDDICGATPIMSINGVRPDEYGNIVLWFH